MSDKPRSNLRLNLAVTAGFLAFVAVGLAAPPLWRKYQEIRRTLVVFVHADGTVYVGGRRVRTDYSTEPPPAAEKSLATLRSICDERNAAVGLEGSPPTSRLRVRIVADQQAPWRPIPAILAECQRHQVQEVGLVQTGTSLALPPAREWLSDAPDESEENAHPHDGLFGGLFDITVRLQEDKGETRVSVTPCLKPGPLQTELARRAKCGFANLHQIGLALIQWSQDHLNRYPDKLEDLGAEYLPDPRVMVCPDHPTGANYSYVSGLLRTDRASYIVAFEPLSNHGGEGANALFVDDHAEWLRGTQLSEALDRQTRELAAVGRAVKIIGPGPGAPVAGPEPPPAERRPGRISAADEEAIRYRLAEVATLLNGMRDGGRALAARSGQPFDERQLEARGLDVPQVTIWADDDLPAATVLDAVRAALHAGKCRVVFCSPGISSADLRRPVEDGHEGWRP